MANLKVGINGFGRIGRNFFRASLTRDADFDIVAANDLGDAKTMAHLLKFDSTLGPFPGDVGVEDGVLHAGGQRDQAARPSAIPARCRGATSASTSCSSRPASSPTARARRSTSTPGAKKVVISAPATDPDITVVPRRQRRHVRPRARTTSSRTPRARRTASARSRRCCNDAFGIENGFMTTIHAYTADQRLQDMPHSDLRRARAAAINLIPTSTGAAKAIGLVLPELAGQLDGVAVRAPVPTGSLTDLVATLAPGGHGRRGERRLRGGCRRARRSQGYLQYSTDPLVSTDINESPYSCIFDSKLTMARGNLVKVFGWYDNEWGYSCRLVDLVNKLARLVRLPRSVRDADVDGKVVLVRADLNVPLEGGRVADDTRIQASLPTIRLLLDGGAREVRVCSHLGRPKTEEDRAKYSMAPVRERVAELVGDEPRHRAREHALQPGRDEERRGLRPRARRRLRPLRQRRVRLGAPRALVDRGGRAPAAGVCGPAPARRARAPRAPARRGRAAVRDRRRRREGRGQGRRAHEPRQPRRHAS